LSRLFRPVFSCLGSSLARRLATFRGELTRGAFWPGRTREPFSRVARTYVRDSYGQLSKDRWRLCVSLTRAIPAQVITGPHFAGLFSPCSHAEPLWLQRTKALKNTTVFGAQWHFPLSSALPPATGRVHGLLCTWRRAGCFPNPA